MRVSLIFANNFLTKVHSQKGDIWSFNAPSSSFVILTLTTVLHLTSVISEVTVAETRSFL